MTWKQNNSTNILVVTLKFHPHPHNEAKEVPPHPHNEAKKVPPHPDNEAKEVLPHSHNEAKEVPPHPHNEAKEVPPHPRNEAKEVPPQPHNEARKVPPPIPTGEAKEVPPHPRNEVKEVPPQIPVRLGSELPDKQQTRKPTDTQWRFSMKDFAMLALSKVRCYWGEYLTIPVTSSVQFVVFSQGTEVVS